MALAGHSVHNQRIEQLWAEMNRVMSALYKDLFGYLENNQLLDSLNEVHLFALHYVYMPCINTSLAEFRQWNHHGLRTANHQTPLELWHTHMIGTLNIPNVVNETAYGIDYDGPLPEITTENVVVPISNVELTQDQIHYLQQHVNPLEEDNSNGIDLYLKALDILENYLHL